jgi:DNA polymerase I
MRLVTLDSFSRREEPEKKGMDSVENLEAGEGEPQIRIEEQKPKSPAQDRRPSNLGVSIVLSVDYDGVEGCAYVKLYCLEDGMVYFWYDNTGHKPYCLTDMSLEEVKRIPDIASHRGLKGFEEVKLYDALNDEEKVMTKIIAKDPLSIGGKPSGCIRDILQPRVWEANIKYHDCYMYDTGIIPCMPYRILEGKLLPIEVDLPREAKEFIDSLRDVDDDERILIERWMKRLEYPVPRMKHLVLDIEVASPYPSRIPDPRKAEYPVVAVALVDSEGSKRILLLERHGIPKEDFSIEGLSVEFYRDEKLLLKEVFEAIDRYPLIVSFNGDDFDLRYLFHRAEHLGFQRSEIPITLSRDSASIRFGIHLDLYKFFFNRSIQVYAFRSRYYENTLEGVASALLGVGKISLDKPISELGYRELAEYCLRDAELTYGLLSYEGWLTFNLMVILSRITGTTLEDLCRQGVSGWIRNMLEREHRVRGWIIPRREDLLKVKGGATTKAVIEGKKYRGGHVIKPEPGIHFQIAVLDFQSMYPSAMQRYNLSYETVRCKHEECRSNIIPGTVHWVCRRRKGITSLLIGSLKDIRVRWYKSKSKDKSLPSNLRDWYSTVSESLKVLINASYGVFGAENFAFYCPPVAEATAAIGRYAIEETIKEARRLGLRVIYGDTDSLFIEKPNPDKIVKLAQWVKSNLLMDIDVDKVYRYTVFSVRKKNYIGVYEDGSVDVKGLTGKKRNTPEFLKTAFAEMTKLLGQVTNEREFEDVKRKIKDLVRKYYTKLKRRELSLEELAFKIMLGKPIEAYKKTTPQHLKAALLLRSIGKEVDVGDIISYVKVVGKIGVKPVELASVEEVDIAKYVDHLKTTFQPILEALDIDFNEAIGLSQLDFYGFSFA